ncbi:MAG: hypothetical protein ACE5R4_16495 [Armatimonadota bacterium]
MRHRFAAVLIAILVLLAVAEAWPQNGQPIVVANKIVARVRDSGPFDSVAQRAADINKRITECISKKEVGEPQMSLKKEDGLWTIYCGTTKLISVYPAEAEANGIEAHELAAMWLKNFERELPNCEPMTDRIKRLGAAAFEKPVRPAGNPTAGEANPTPPTAAESDPPAPVPVSPPPSTPEASPSGRSPALLVVLNYFDIVRGMDEETFGAQKDELGRNLMTYLAPFITAAERPGGPGAPTPTAPVTSVAPGGRAPVLVESDEGPRPVVVPIEPTTTVGETTVRPTPTTGEPTSRVPQKQRIRRKMNALRQPLADMKAAGDARATQLEELLSAARKNYYADEFDSSEELVDAALELAGIQVE